MKDLVKMAVGKTIKKLDVRVHEDEHSATVDMHFTDDTQLSVLVSVGIGAIAQFYPTSQDCQPVEKKFK